MRFTQEDASRRYQATLTNMQPAKMAQLGAGWDKATLAFFFNTDQTLAAISARDTLLPMLQEDRRTLDRAILQEFLDAVGLDQQAGDVAQGLFDTYSDSMPLG